MENFFNNQSEAIDFMSSEVSSIGERIEKMKEFANNFIIIYKSCKDENLKFSNSELSVEAIHSENLITNILTEICSAPYKIEKNLCLFHRHSKRVFSDIDLVFPFDSSAINEDNGWYMYENIYIASRIFEAGREIKLESDKSILEFKRKFNFYPSHIDQVISLLSLV